VYWTSGDTTIAAVSASGVVTGRKLGITRVFASVPGADGDATVRVVLPTVATVAVSPASATVGVDATRPCTAAVRDASGAERSDRTVFWSSDNEAVASVAPFTGVVTGRAPGTARITATVDGRVGGATVTVAAGATPAPSRSLVASFTFGCTRLICAFTDATSAEGGSVVSWAWSFGNGQLSPFRNSDHTYAAPGSYTVTLTATDDRGASASVSKTLAVTNSASTVRLVSRASGRCLTVAGPGDGRGARLIERACDGRPDQLVVLPTGEGPGPVQFAGFDGRYAEADLQTSEPQTWSWNGSQHQRWSYTSLGQLRNYSTNMCIRASGDGSKAVLVGCAAEANQQWDARP
jgi:PKD repeat protein